MRRGVWHRGTGTPRYQSDINSQRVEQPRSFADALQPDIQQFGQARETLQRRGVAHLGTQNWAEIDRGTILSIRMANRSAKILVANQPLRIMQQSMNRKQFTIGNTTGVVLLWNFGAPTLPGSGIPIPVNGKDGRGGSSCPVDEIWVTSSIAGSIVTAYESVAIFP